MGQRRFPKEGSESAEFRRPPAAIRAQPSRHKPARKMSFLRVAFRGPAVTFARNRASVSAVTIPRRTWLPQRAAFSAAAGLTHKEITNRVLDVLKGFEKVDPNKARNTKVNVVLQNPDHVLQVTPEASFTGDLGLDSLDAVEVVMAVEEVSRQLVAQTVACTHETCRSSPLKSQMRRQMRSRRYSRVSLSPLSYSRF